MIAFCNYTALAAGVPFLHPYLNKDDVLVLPPGLGENFAVAGSTALSAYALAKKNISSPVTNSSLHVQLDWMSTHFNKTCGNNFSLVLAASLLIYVMNNIYNYTLIFTSLFFLSLMLDRLCEEA